MSEPPPRLLSIESPFPKARSTLHLLEGTDACRASICDQIFRGTYDKPFIIDNGSSRRLHFNLDSVQSAMYLRDPYRLSLVYTRKMMSFLLFNSAPRRVLLLGLGGGSLAKFCERRLPAASVTTVEVDRNVLALRGEFSIPGDSDRFRVVRADAAAYLADLRRRKDVIIADACDHEGTAPRLNSLAFYENCRRCLSAHGLLVANLCGGTLALAAHLGKIRQVFGPGVVTLPVRRHLNLIVFAFKQGPPKLSWHQLQSIAIDLRGRFGVNFPAYLRRIEHVLGPAALADGIRTKGRASLTYPD